MELPASFSFIPLAELLIPNHEAAPGTGPLSNPGCRRLRRSRRPFHPARLWDAVFERPTLPPTLRSKGFFWVAARPRRVWEWSTAGAASLACLDFGL